MSRDRLTTIEQGAAWRLHGRRPGVDRAPAVHVATYGCQMNEHDSEVIYGLLQEMGYRPTRDLEDADVLLFNTCAVRESAVEHAFGRIGQLKPLKYKNPDLIIGVCGCVPQVPGEIERMRRLFPHLDLIFGTHNIQQLPELIEQARQTRQTVVDVWESMGDVIEHLPAQRLSDIKAWVTIMYGCDKRCTYCIVPMTRGAERSRLPEHILAEVQDLGRRGIKEVTLLGQNVNAYGRDLTRAGAAATDFGDLLRLLDREVVGIERIRYTTSHPRDFTAKMVADIAATTRVCEHFHLPVQAGSDRVLRRMKRSYNRSQYLRLVQQIRAQVPGASITTDIIVGFPGETAEDFAATLSLVELVRFDAAFTFLYSPRAGTEAAAMADELTPAEKKARLQHLNDLQYRIAREINEELVGQVVEVLVEGPSKTDPERFSGRTRTGKLVHFPATDTALYGNLAPVRITAAQTFTLSGELLRT